jgi:hypothetical protein
VRSVVGFTLTAFEDAILDAAHVRRYLTYHEDDGVLKRSDRAARRASTPGPH